LCMLIRRSLLAALRQHLEGNGHAKRGTLVERKGDAVALAFGTKRLAFEIADAPSCSDCGSIMVRNGSCYKCVNCGSTSGCS